MNNKKNQQIRKLVEFKETNSRPKKKNNWTNQKETNSRLKKIERKTEIDYSKKKVKKEVLDNLRYQYLESVRKYM